MNGPREHPMTALGLVVAELGEPQGLGAKRHAEWYRAHGCSHAHCAGGCEHPQPLLAPTGDLICGLCWVFGKTYTLMVPCTPALCGEEAPQ